MFVSLKNIICIKLRKFISLALLLAPCIQANGQDSSQYKGYTLSAVVIADMNKGFDVDKFIQRVQNDSTFYKAFKTLSLVSYTQYNDVKFYNNKMEQTEYYSSISRQLYDGKCRTMETTQADFSNRYFKQKNEPRFITAQFYHKLFLIDQKVCNENDIVNGGLSLNENKRINQLKKLVFKPGESVRGVPGVGAKLGIFEEKRKGQYNFTITKELYNGDWCYVFRADPKAVYKKSNVINYLYTWFRIKDYAIVQRKYSLSYNTLMYDFDVVMDVKLKTLGTKLIPYEVRYNGNWHFVGKKRERADFTTIITDFR